MIDTIILEFAERQRLQRHGAAAGDGKAGVGYMLCLIQKRAHRWDDDEVACEVKAGTGERRSDQPPLPMIPADPPWTQNEGSLL